VNTPDADVIHPNLAVHRKACRHDHSLLRHVTIDVGREGKGLELLGAGSNFTMPPCSIMPRQMFPSLSISISRLPCGKPLLNSEMGYSVTLPVLGSSLPRYCEPKSLYHAGDIDNHVMRHCDFARQIVFGNDDAPGPAGGPRQRFQRDEAGDPASPEIVAKPRRSSEVQLLHQASCVLPAFTALMNV